MEEVLRKLTDYYHSFLKALPRIALAILVVVIGVLIANWITKMFRKNIGRRSHDKLMASFLAKAIKLVLMIVVILFALNIAGLSGVAAAILATAGASAVVIGFAFKDIAENFLAGIILAFNRPFHINDTVRIEDIFGKVVEMEFRYTKIITFDGRSVYLPNSDVLTKPVFNYTEDGFYRTDFIVGIAYENDINKAKQLIEKCCADSTELVHDDDHVNFVIEDELAPSTVNLKVYIWVNTKDFRRNMLEVRGRLITNIKTVLEANGFNLPADIREVKFYSDSKPFQVVKPGEEPKRETAT